MTHTQLHLHIKYYMTRYKKVSFMGYDRTRETIKWWDLHTNKLKYCSSETFDEHHNKCGKGWSPGYEFLNGKNISALKTLKLYLSDHPFTKYDIFEAAVSFPSRVSPIVIFVKYCGHHNMSYVFRSKNNSP